MFRWPRPFVPASHFKDFNLSNLSIYKISGLGKQPRSWIPPTQTGGKDGAQRLVLLGTFHPHTWPAWCQGRGCAGSPSTARWRAWGGSWSASTGSRLECVLERFLLKHGFVKVVIEMLTKFQENLNPGEVMIRTGETSQPQRGVVSGKFLASAWS